jgi:hypothetical protein
MRLKDRGTRNVRQRKTKETIRILHQQAMQVGK